MHPRRVVNAFRYGSPITRLAITGVFAVAVTAVVVLTWVIAGLGPDEADGSSEPDGLDVHTGGGFGVGPSSPEATRRAKLIVRGEVVRSLDPIWNTPDSKRLDLTDRQIVMRSGHTIFTPYVVSVEEVLYGSVSEGREVLLRQAHGQIGEDRFVLEDGPRFNVGDTIIAFLRRCSDARVERLGSEAFRYLGIGTWVVEGDQIIDPAGYAYPLDKILSNIEAEKGKEPLATPPAC